MQMDLFFKIVFWRELQHDCNYTKSWFVLFPNSLISENIFTYFCGFPFFICLHNTKPSWVLSTEQGFMEKLELFRSSENAACGLN